MFYDLQLHRLPSHQSAIQNLLDIEVSSLDVPTADLQLRVDICGLRNSAGHLTSMVANTALPVLGSQLQLYLNIHDWPRTWK